MDQPDRLNRRPDTFLLSVVRDCSDVPVCKVCGDALHLFGVDQGWQVWYCRAGATELRLGRTEHYDDSMHRRQRGGQQWVADMAAELLELRAATGRSVADTQEVQ